jgi:hypothetical protein
LVQLCHQSDSYSDILYKFYSEHANGSRHPSNGALAGFLKDLLKLPGHAPVYLIVDVLDECPNTSSIPPPRDEVLNLIEELIKSQISSLRMHRQPTRNGHQGLSRSFGSPRCFPKRETLKSTSSQLLLQKRVESSGQATGHRRLHRKSRRDVRRQY